MAAYLQGVILPVHLLDSILCQPNSPSTNPTHHQCHQALPPTQLTKHQPNSPPLPPTQLTKHCHQAPTSTGCSSTNQHQHLHAQQTHHHPQTQVAHLKQLPVQPPVQAPTSAAIKRHSTFARAARARLSFYNRPQPGPQSVLLAAPDSARTRIASSIICSITPFSRRRASSTSRLLPGEGASVEASAAVSIDNGGRDSLPCLRQCPEACTVLPVGLCWTMQHHQRR